MTSIVSIGSLNQPCHVARRIEGYDIVRVLVGAVLLTAAAMKGYELATGPVAGKGFLTSRWFLIVAVEFELALGLCLVGGVWKRQAWWVAVLSFAGFACIAAYKAWQGEASCGCFGRAEIDPRYTLILDVTLLAALIAWRPRIEGPPMTRRRTAAVLAAVIGIGLLVAVVMASVQTASAASDGTILGNSPFVVLQPEKWVGKRFPLLPHIDIGQQLSRGKWIIVLYGHNCSYCQAAIPRYRDLARVFSDKSETTRLALVEMPPYSLTDAISDSSCYRGRLAGTREWFVQLPVELHVVDGQVSAINAD